MEKESNNRYFEERTCKYHAGENVFYSFFSEHKNGDSKTDKELDDNYVFVHRATIKKPGSLQIMGIETDGWNVSYTNQHFDITYEVETGGTTTNILQSDIIRIANTARAAE